MRPDWPVIPMEMATLPASYDSADTLFQVKWDGVRCLAYAEPGEVRLFNRKRNPRTLQYPELVAALSTLPEGTVLDGEVIALGPDGKPGFPLVLRRDLARSAQKLRAAISAIPVSYMVFDVLWHAGKPLLERPLRERLDVLAQLPLAPPISRVDTVPEQGKALFAAVEAEGLEGIVAKRADSLYLPGQRTPLWQKIKCRREIKAVVGGYVPKPDGVRCVLIGIWEEGELLYVGKAGTGLTMAQWSELAKRLRAIPGPCPFAHRPPEPGAVFVRPVIPATVRFLEYTQDGVMRAPVLARLEEL